MQSRYIAGFLVSPLPDMRATPTSVLLAVSMSFAFAACSGGGGGGTPAPRPIQLGDAQVGLTSPQDGEDGVAITRETIVRFTAPIDPSTADDQSLFATVAGARLPARIHVAADRRAATLFYTDPQGLPAGARVRVTVDGDRLRSANGAPADADGDGITGGIGGFEFATLDLTVVPGTEVCGRVLASDFQSGVPLAPLPGVTVSVDGLPGAVTRTDRFGNFCLREIPAGRVFVHIDGTTSTANPPGFYFPSVGKAWETVAGQRTVVGTVHLPAIAEGGLTQVSNNSNTSVSISSAQLQTITDPALQQALAQVVVDVPAGSLFNGASGTRGGSVGLAPVPSNRLPGTLPPGLDLPLVITVQVRGGTDFDEPVPVAFPNLAPAGGQPLPAGAKSALWSFNHDTGRFEVVGPMTVSQDGKTIVTDPGVGIRAPGWHGTQAGSGGSGSPPSGPGPNPCTPSFWDVTKTVYAVAGSLADCAKELLGIKAALNCFLSAKGLLEAMYAQVNNLIKRLEDGNLTAAEAAAIAKELTKKKNQAVGLMGCFENADPSARIKQVVVCSEAALSILNELCKLFDKCTTIWGKEQACNLIALAQGLAAEAKGLLGIFEEYKKKLLMNAFCKALEQALGLLEQYLSLPSARTIGANPTQEEVLAALEAANAWVPQINALEPEIARVNALPASARSLLRQMTDVNSGIVDSAGAPRKAEVLYALLMESDPVSAPRRGRTTTLGTFFEIVPANQVYSLAQYDPANDEFGIATGISSGNGQTTTFHTVALDAVDGLPDTDADGLVDLAEYVAATDPTNPDTDGDGETDFDELRAGTNPLDGVGTAAGTAVAADTPGLAFDVCLDEGVAVVADQQGGISVFNVYAGLTPEWIAVVDTPAPALRVACSEGLAIAAMGAAGAAIVDLRQLPDAAILHEVGGRDIGAVDAAAGVAYTAGSGGDVRAWDLRSGQLLAEVSVGHSVGDLAVQGEYVYALGSAQLTAVHLGDGTLSVASTTTVSLGLRNERVAAAGDCLLVAHALGYATLDVTVDPANPGAPVPTSTTQRGWRDAVLDGSGFLLAAASVNVSPAPSTDHVYLHRLPDCSMPGTFSRFFGTPGIARAVQSYEGLAYVADDSVGLRVVRYLDPDVGGEAPEITLTTNAPAAGIEEGTRAVVRAQVSDDVQVRNVDLWVGGTLVATDGTFPFETSFVVPRAAQQSSVQLTARAHDTAGNTADATPVDLIVLPDTTPPAVLATRPSDGGFVATGVAPSITVRFSENLEASTVTADALRVEDDQQNRLPVGAVSWLPTMRTATWTLSAPLDPGAYTAILTNRIEDVAGNPLTPLSWDFTTVDGRLVVSHDEWTLSPSGFSASATTQTFAENVADFFTGGASGNFLVYTGNFGLNNSSFTGALTAAGHTVTVDRSMPFTASLLQNYDGVFLAYDGGTPLDPQILADYVAGGGGVYIAGGTGSGGAAGEAAAWNPFLDRFGIAFESRYNGIGGTRPVSSTHAVFAGVTNLYQGNGATLVPVSQPTIATIVEGGLYAVFPN